MPPLVASITELPPPPVAEPKAAPKPKRRASATARATVPVATPTPAPAPEAPPLESPDVDADPGPEIATAAPKVAEPVDEPVAVAATEPQSPPRHLPPRIDLAYRAFLGTQGFQIGDATYRLEHSGGQYKILTVGQARGLAALLFPGEAKARSEGAITATGLQPDSYSIERTSTHRREAATFDWETGMVLLKDEKSMPLEMPTFDPLVVLWQFYFSPPTGDEMQFNVATTRKIYHYGFKRVGTEKITLPFGDVDTEIWKKVNGDGVIDAQFWLAPKLRYVAVKVRLNNGRVTVEGLLDSIRVDESETVAQQ